MRPYTEETKSRTLPVRSTLLSQSALVALIIACVGLSSFALGWLAGSDSVHIEPTIERTVPAKGEGDVGLYVASKNSDIFHFAWCSGASRIADQNKISFATEEEARRSGYTPAKNCPGLDN
ncbi:MAG: hypothetical protein WDZ82_00270 [Candidatus Paceibacterota bacterium]